ncbi:MAG: hypothetical protein ABIB47_01655 [Candidatus Woesearchaeota archaeon]
MALTLIELLGLGGFALGVINLILLWAKHRKDKPIIKIEKNIYKKHPKFEELSPKDYANKVMQGELNDASKYGIRNLIVDITNEGHRGAELKGVSPSYKQKGGDNFPPKVINFYPTTISAGDRKSINLFFEFPAEIIERIEKTLPNTIFVEFDFAHKKIKKKFIIGKNSFVEKR